jgi:hypothetical protein
MHARWHISKSQLHFQTAQNRPFHLVSLPSFTEGSLSLYPYTACFFDRSPQHRNCHGHSAGSRLSVDKSILLSVAIKDRHSVVYIYDTLRATLLITTSIK